MRQLTTIESIKTGDSRFVSTEINDNRIIPMIIESEQLDIKNQIGNDLYVDLLQYVNSSEEDKKNFPDYSTLLDGGFYDYVSDCGENGSRYLKGLTNTVNYFVWARLVKYNQFNVTRFGVVRKKDEYSENVGYEELNRLYLDTMAIAKGYLNDCILYLKSNREKFPKFKKTYLRNMLNIQVIR